MYTPKIPQGIRDAAYLIELVGENAMAAARMWFDIVN
jgi:hypothetical protein